MGKESKESGERREGNEGVDAELNSLGFCGVFLVFVC